MTVRNLSPQQMFIDLVADHVPAYRFTGGSKKQFASWKRRALPKVMATLGAVGLPPVSRQGVYEQPPVEDLKKLRRSRDQSMPAWAEGERTPS